MEPSQTCAILNELLEAEHRALLPRLLEAKAFVTADRTADFESVRRMAGEHGEQMARLAETIIELGGEPVPRSADITSASFHYNRLPVLLPRVIADQEQLCRRYDQAIEALTDCGEAAEVAVEIAGRHRVHLEYLRRLAAEVAPRSG